MAIYREAAIQVDDIRRIPLFKSLSDRALRLMSALLSRRQVRKGDRLYREGQPCDRFLVILEGRFNILKTSADGRQKIVGEVLPRQHFGLAELVTGRRSNATLEAAEPGTVLLLSRDDFIQTLLDNPRMCLRLMQTMAFTIMDLSNQVQQVSFERVSVRLARLILSLADREGRTVNGRLMILHRYSHQEVARRLGTSRETVTRMLRHFKELGLVATEGRRLIVLDRSGLRELIDKAGIGNEPPGR